MRIVTILNIVFGIIAISFLVIANLVSPRSKYLPTCSLVFIGTLIMLMVFNILLVENYTFGNIIGVLFSQCVLGLFLLRFEVHRFICYLIFYLFVALLVLVLVGVINVADEEWEFFASTSRNYASFFLIYSLFPLCISNSFKKKPLPIVPLLITLILSILSVGRGGIIMSGILFVFTLFVTKTKDMTKKKKFFYRVFKILVIASIVFIVVRQDILLQIIPRFFSSGSFEVKDTGRIGIWSNYIKNSSSFGSFLFGFNGISSTGQKTGGNLHNSFLQIHSNLGLLGLGLFLVFIANGIIFLIKKREYQLLVFLLTILFKGAVDLSFGFYYGDSIIMFFILYPFYTYKKKSFNHISYLPCTTNSTDKKLYPF